MERDTKRSRGQWRGCYAFTDIICDGDGGSSPKRTGGLKMGSTYYYYYELDDGTEHYDSSLPSTTSCPYLPGQPVNLLSVPVEVQPLRYRSASMSSMANGNVMTMNPADKFMAPRRPPPTPTTPLPRLNTSPTAIAKRRPARSLSPNKAEKSPWSPRSFFGLRSPSISSSQDDKRGRSVSLSKTAEANASRSNISLALRSEEARKVKSVPHTRDTSPQSLQRLNSREPSPIRQLARDNTAYQTTTLLIPDEIAEEAEDDDNFASQLNRISLNERGILTQLSPPPQRMRSQSPRAHTATNTSKPLPQLPEETLMPPPLRLRAAVSAAELPRSHFSMSTISTTISSPTDSHFNFSETPSFSDSYDEDDFSADLGSGDEFTCSPIRDNGFSSYSLPDEQFAFEHTIRKATSVSQLTKSATQTTFGGATAFETSTRPDAANMTALEELMSEVGYLGGVIVGGK